MAALSYSSSGMLRRPAPIKMKLMPLASQMDRMQMMGKVQVVSLSQLMLVPSRWLSRPMDLCKIILKLMAAAEEAMAMGMA